MYFNLYNDNFIVIYLTNNLLYVTTTLLIECLLPALIRCASLNGGHITL